MGVVVDKYLTVGEWAQDVDSGIEIKNNDWLDISVSGTIWAGVWATGRNGPEGWRGHVANSDSPLPGSPPFGLLGKTAEDDYFWIGSALRRTYLNETLGPGATRLFFRINDDVAGNGNGAFHIHLQVWR